MKISFVIPAYNEASTIGKCLGTLQTEIKKNGRHVETEIIVVNNASTDSTKEVARTFPNVIVVDELRKGLARARQAGFEKTTGDIIANIDADTLVPDGWLTTIIEEFTKHPNLVALTGPQVYYDVPKYIRAIMTMWYASGLVFDSLSKFVFKKGSLLQGGNNVIRKSALDKIGGYDTSFEFYGEDINTGRRLNEIGRVTWTFRFPIFASGRRLNEHGLLKTGYVYITAFFFATILKKAYTQKYIGVREAGSKK